MITLPEIIGAFISDAVTVASTAAGCPVPGALVGSMLSEYLHRRAAEAREILIEELKLGGATGAEVASENDAMAVIWRFLRASIEGSARINLRLLAKAIVGRFQTGTLVADEFLQYAEALATLSREEILVLGAMYRHWKAHSNFTVAEREAAGPSFDPWELTLRELTAVGVTEEVVSTIASRSLRSGLLYPMFGRVGHAAARHGNLSFCVSPLLVELGTTLDFEDALRREASDQQRKD